MCLLDILMNANKPGIWKTFQALGRSTAPKVGVPLDPKEAILLGYRRGLQEGYGKGLVDGVDLGSSIGALVDTPQAILTESVEVC